MQLTQTLGAWGTTSFKAVFMREIKKLSVNELPLQQGLTTGSYALDRDIEVMILNSWESDGFIHVKAGIFYKSVIAGCSCSDDPTPVDKVDEHCEVMIEIGKTSGEATITLLQD